MEAIDRGILAMSDATVVIGIFLSLACIQMR
jgi:hypothetical protein